MKCPHCQEELGINNICINVTCSYFGTEINSSDKSFNIYNDNISRDEFAAFIGNYNTDYYLEHIDKMKNNNRFLSWNWPCFFFSSYWLLYRKLYALAITLIVFNLCFSLLFNSRIPILFMLLIRILLAIYANALYLNNSYRKIKAIKTTISNLSTTQYINRLHKKGGINLVAPLILILVYILVIIILIVLFFLFQSMTNPTDFSFPPSSPSYHY